MTISGELTELLRAGRYDFNRRVTEARHRYPALNTAMFSDFLLRYVDPLVAVVSAERRGSFVSAAYDIGLELVGRELCGAHARGVLLEQFWCDVLPDLVARLPAQPAPQLSALCNALLNLQAQGARTAQWFQLLREFGPVLANTSLFELGLLAAWRAGAVQFRDAAIRVAAEQPDAARALLALPADRDMATLVRLLAKDPWLLSEADSSVAQREVGAFIGFGGLFTQPPVVRACAEGFLVESGTHHFLLLADSFGEVLLPAGAEEYQAAANYKCVTDCPPILENDCLLGLRRQVAIDRCCEGTQLVWNEHSAALFSPYSFAIRVVPWR